jgi:hypothetical protein
LRPTVRQHRQRVIFPTRQTVAYSRLQDGPTMSLIISVLITFLVIILILYLVNLLPIDGRAKQIVRVVVIVLGILSMLKYLAVL